MKYLETKIRICVWFLLALLDPMPSLTSATWSATQNESYPGESPYRLHVHHLKRSQSWRATALVVSLLVDQRHSVYGKGRSCSILRSSAIQLIAGIWIV